MVHLALNLPQLKSLGAKHAKGNLRDMRHLTAQEQSLLRTAACPVLQGEHVQHA